MKKMIRKFVGVNRRICRYLEARFPKYFLGNAHYHNDLCGLIDDYIENSNPKTILEVGGIDRPLISKSDKYVFVGLDIEERPTCYEVYDKFLVQSIEETVDEEFDLVISTTLLEHVPNNTKSMRSIYNALSKGGMTFHYVPSKNHFYSIALRIVGPRWQNILISYLRPAAADVTGYPAFFDKCSPSEMKSLLNSTGFSDVKITTYYKATDYFAFFVPAYLVVGFFEFIFEKLRWSYFASGMVILARK